MFQNFLAAMGFYNFLIIFSYDSSGGDLYEEYGHDRPGVCLGEGQTEDGGRRKVDAATRCSGV